MTSADHSAVVNGFSRESWLQDQYIILGNVWFGTWKGKEKKKDLRGEKNQHWIKAKALKYCSSAWNVFWGKLIKECFDCFFLAEVFLYHWEMLHRHSLMVFLPLLFPD